MTDPIEQIREALEMAEEVEGSFGWYETLRLALEALEGATAIVYGEATRPGGDP